MKPFQSALAAALLLAALLPAHAGELLTDDMLRDHGGQRLGGL